MQSFFGHWVCVIQTLGELCWMETRISPKNSKKTFSIICFTVIVPITLFQLFVFINKYCVCSIEPFIFSIHV